MSHVGAYCLLTRLFSFEDRDQRVSCMPQTSPKAGLNEYGDQEQLLPSVFICAQQQVNMHLYISSFFKGDPSFP
jgi:CobQ-like glutamine amidotransferase family enzyme